MNDELARLAELLKRRNALECEITDLIARPASIGHIGEFVASRIFNISLQHSASAKGIDGYFNDGNLKGRSVNIKWYAMREGLLDITPEFLPDYYLVLAGARSAAMSSRGKTRPWTIDSVHIFNTATLIDELRARGVALGIACSVANSFWANAELHPNPTSTELMLSSEQRQQLMLFRAT
jgi:hypothetical protein